MAPNVPVYFFAMVSDKPKLSAAFFDQSSTLAVMLGNTVSTTFCTSVRSEPNSIQDLPKAMVAPTDNAAAIVAPNLEAVECILEAVRSNVLPSLVIPTVPRLATLLIHFVPLFSTSWKALPNLLWISKPALSTCFLIPSFPSSTSNLTAATLSESAIMTHHLYCPKAIGS